MVGEVLLSPRMSSTKVCMKLFNMACHNFGERGGTNLNSRLLEGYVGSLVGGPSNSSHGQQVKSLIPMLLRSQWQWVHDVNGPLLL
jgi:hypothetical protein